MSRIDATFAALARARPQGADPLRHRRRPARRHDAAIMRAMAEAGADVIELGVPFSDPMADGPVIQKASERALARGIGLRRRAGDGARLPRQRRDDAGRPDGLCEPDRALRQSTRFVADAKAPASTACWSSTTRPRSASSSPRCCAAPGIDPIFLLAPTSTDARIASVAEVGERIRLPCLAEGRHRCRPLRHRRGQAT